MYHSNIRCSLSCLPLLVLVLPLYACGDETVDLGGGRISQQITRGARCVDSPVVSGSVRVTSQAELAELEGCEEIDGDLHVNIFPGADLSPLASLRVVDGLLELGAYPEFPAEGVETSEMEALLAEVNEIAADGYLSSLAGLENLERATSLQFYYLTAPDLSSLQALRELSGHEGSLPVGFVGLQNSQVRSLHGLEKLENVRELVTAYNPELESLGGITLGANVVNINLVGSPKLASIAELANVEIANTVYLDDIGITDVDALSTLYYAEYGISVSNNRHLLNIDGLSGARTSSLFINRNAVLSSIPALSNLEYLEYVMIVDNPQLETIELALPPHGALYTMGTTLLPEPVGMIEIGENDHLTTLSIGAGLEQARFVVLHENPLLASVALGTLTQIESLAITANPSLVDLDLGALRTVGTLSAIDNPSLDDGPLRAVRTFETTLLGNAPTVSP